MGVLEKKQNHSASLTVQGLGQRSLQRVGRLFRQRLEILLVPVAMVVLWGVGPDRATGGLSLFPAAYPTTGVGQVRASCDRWDTVVSYLSHFG